MILKNYSTLLFLIMSFSSWAQDYAITHSGDTLYYKKVKNLQPKEVKSYRVGYTVYETHDIGKNKPNLVFLRPIVRGYCSLYEYEYTETYFVNGVLRSGQPITEYYLKRRDEKKAHKFNFGLLKTEKDNYFLDDGPLTFDIRHGKYSRYDVIAIVQRYNSDMAIEGRK